MSGRARTAHSWLARSRRVAKTLGRGEFAVWLFKHSAELGRHPGRMTRCMVRKECRGMTDPFAEPAGYPSSGQEPPGENGDPKNSEGPEGEPDQQDPRDPDLGFKRLGSKELRVAGAPCPSPKSSSEERGERGIHLSSPPASRTAVADWTRVSAEARVRPTSCTSRPWHAVRVRRLLARRISFQALSESHARP